LELLKINPHNYQFIIGGGTDFYLKYFKFGIEIRMAYGINDITTRRGTVLTKFTIHKIKNLLGCFYFSRYIHLGYEGKQPK